MRRNLGYALTLAALLITIPRYAAAFRDIDTTIATAIGMSLLLALGTAYIFDAWTHATRHRRKHANRLLIAFALNLCYEPLIVTPLILSRLYTIDLSATMTTSYAVLWSIAVAAAPVILIAGIVYAVSFQKHSRTRPVTPQPPPDTDQPSKLTFDQWSATVHNADTLTGHDIAVAAGVSDRTGRRWLDRIKENHRE
jgi:hypothetical protein